MTTIYDQAIKIVKTLFKAGHTAYFAGGWVRDRLLGKKETDEIDIATSAPPEIIQSLFPKTIPVGIAFGVVIVVVEGVHFEITTFRKDHDYQDGRHPNSIDYSTAEKDAQRRDFTINGMFYDPLQDKVLDFVGGKEDLKRKVIRAIGDPSCRFKEDRLRMIRAVRFAARFGFSIETKTEEAIVDNAPTLFPSVSIERIWQEFNKMKAYPRFHDALIMLHRLQLLQTIFPSLSHVDLSEIEKRVSPLPYFPFDSPTIIYLLELFPNATLKEREALCRYLKATRGDLHLVQFFTHAETLFKKPHLEPVEWAHFYAHPLSALFLQVEGARKFPPEKIHFMERHEKQRAALEKQIVRIQTHHPILTAAHLKERGIIPGKAMGLLLKEGEKIAINENIEDPMVILKKLSHSPHWP